MQNGQLLRKTTTKRAKNLRASYLKPKGWRMQNH